ncbi:glycosyltransferase [Thiohalobacter thiocyanaticus]|uniref:Glycosyltransferase n=1 Tax=Thiohalobacter thiocyanaticus TaxID=585455 RepID=A0A1Z4VMZ2_9GAMM|nr:glycosyltransferase family 2 protein [Thiohalobacter thiocyanaticus]BAZ92989.1 glycosyltransferase [Thiohalobacter thiocyanaticus]
MRAPVSVVILTLDEEVNIGRCLDSVAWCDDVVVLDSFSTDRTCEIARGKGARIVERAFDNYANQRNHALKEIDYSNDWLLMLDADEVVPGEMVEEMAATLTGGGEDVTLYRMRRKDYFMGSWLKHSTNYSTLWFGRLMRLGRVWVEREINEEYHTDGLTRDLDSAIVHYPFNKGLSAWVEKHNRYSSMEAELLVHGGGYEWKLRELFDSDPVARRKALKALIYSMPGRPLVMFLGRYFVAGGVLDGRAGLMFCLLKSWYEYLIDCKAKELRRRMRGLPV